MSQELQPSHAAVPSPEKTSGSSQAAAEQGNQSPGFVGLTEQEARRRLSSEGFNELPTAGPRSFLDLIREIFTEPMLLILIATGVIYLLLGDPGEALSLLVAIFLIFGIELYQTRKTERALEALRNLSSPRALVIRDGVQKRIPGREVARGDLVVLS
jgi:Ca2+-transporting ATPase